MELIMLHVRYVSLNAPEALAKMMIERAKETIATAREKTQVLECDVAFVHLGSGSSP